MTRRLLLLFAAAFRFRLAQNRVYELRTYTCYDGKAGGPQGPLRRSHHRHFQASRHGEHRLLGAARPGESKTRLIYILAHPSLEAARKNWDAFRADPEWVKAKASPKRPARSCRRPNRST